MKKSYKILVVNPGSTSTKITVFNGKEVLFEETLNHTTEDLKNYKKIVDQYNFRKEAILNLLRLNNYDLVELDAVAGRGGLLKPIPGGTYKVNRDMLSDLKSAKYGEHASNLGAIISYEIANSAGIDAYIVDPVVVDELDDLARISGFPEITRKSIFHALNQKAIARRVAIDTGKEYEQSNLIIAHLGGGISVAAHRNGKVVDVNNALDGDGPFSPERSGGVPFGDLMKICFSGKYEYPQLKKQFVGQGGLVAYLGTNDARVVLGKISKGDKKAKLVYKAMAYQIAKEIAAQSAVLNGKVDCIALTGGLTKDKLIISWIKERVSFLAPVKVYPGEDESSALYDGVVRVLDGVEKGNVYRSN